jgi:hypothetical protein
MEHPLHKIIGEGINNDKFPGCIIKKDPACGGGHNVPLIRINLKAKCPKIKAKGERRKAGEPESLKAGCLVVWLSGFPASFTFHFSN